MQTCTVARGNTTLTLSGKPLRPSQTTKNASPHAPVLEVCQHAHPEPRRLASAVAGPQPEDVAFAREVDPDRGVERLVTDLPVAHLDASGGDRVDEHRGVHRQQRT